LTSSGTEQMILAGEIWHFAFMGKLRVLLRILSGSAKSEILQYIHVKIMHIFGTQVISLGCLDMVG
jgi:hypothetical protein